MNITRNITMLVAIIASLIAKSNTSYAVTGADLAKALETTDSGFPVQGYIQTHKGEKCWYDQTEQLSSNLLFKRATSNVRILRFRDKQCMKYSLPFERDTNIMMINNIITVPYAQDGANFATRTNELYKPSLYQIKGKCIQSRAFPTISVAVDYIEANKSITEVQHSMAIQGCEYR